MDEQKIQLESRLDYDHVRTSFMNYLKSLKDCKKFSMEELEHVHLGHSLVISCLGDSSLRRSLKSLRATSKSMGRTLTRPLPAVVHTA